MSDIPSESDREAFRKETRKMLRENKKENRKFKAEHCLYIWRYKYPEPRSDDGSTGEIRIIDACKRREKTLKDVEWEPLPDNIDNVYSWMDDVFPPNGYRRLSLLEEADEHQKDDY